MGRTASLVFDTTMNAARATTGISETRKAIIEVAGKGSAVSSARRQLAVARRGRTPDYRSSFESARSLFAELTPARLEELGLIERDDESAISVPFDSVEILVPLAWVA